MRRLTQEHGAAVVVVGDGPGGQALALSGTAVWAPGPDGLAPAGDALVAADDVVALAVLTADCAAVALGSPEGIFAAVHAGWRGLLAGVVQRAVAVMRAAGAGEVVAALGPCIHPCCYEFAAPELDALARRYSDDVRGVTTGGRPALDLPAGVGAALGEAGVELVGTRGGCTGCGPDAFSFRSRHDEGRQALLVWRSEQR